MASSRKLKKRLFPQEDKDQEHNKPVNNKPRKRKEKRDLLQKSNTNENNKSVNTTKETSKKTDENANMKNIKVMYANADQLTSGKLHELQSQTQKEKPHIVAICEVKTKIGALKQLQEYEFKEYELVNQTNVTTDKGRGIIILAHNSIKHLVVKIEPMTEFDESCIVEIRLCEKDLLVFGCLYRSPTRSDSSDANNRNLNELVKAIASEKKYTHKCLVGDFNFPTINWENWTTPHSEESKEEQFLDALRDAFFYQNVDEPTRCRGSDDPSTIDLILTYEQNQINDLKYLSPLGKSDHSTLTFTFDCYTQRKKNSRRYAFELGDYAKMQQHLQNTEWSKEIIGEIRQKSVEDMWKIFKGKMLDLRNRFIPVKEIDCQSWKEKGKIPIDKDLRNEIDQKRQLHRLWLRSTCPVEKARNRTNYITSRNRVNRMMTRARRLYERNICDKSKSKPKIFWSHVRSKLKSASGVASLLESPKDKSSLKHEDHEKANILQNQFCSVFTIEPHGELPEFPSRTDNVIEDIVILKEKVHKQILKLDVNKSFGPDEIHPKLLKELADHIAEPLSVIMNKTLTEGALPEDWKLAHVTPIYKNKGAQNLAVNYRPVSLTSIICKLMESILREHIMNHLVDLKLLSQKQYGFINKRSTVTQLLSYLDKCCESIANGKVVDCIYFDFAKAFDTVPHRRLCKKLAGYGIKGQLLKWITSFLNGRKQLVKVNEAKSTTDAVVSGIPQGSVLGPLLFVLYINDLPDKVISSILLFADDTKIFKEVDSITDSLIIQKDIEELEKWSTDWLLQFHPDKCHVLTIGKFANIKHAHPYTLSEDQLEHVFTEKDLGILIDAELTFEEHISKQVNKANSILGTIKRSFENLTPQIFLTLYGAFVRPHLEYAQSVWSPKLRKHVNLIEGVQRRATKLISLYRNLPYEERLRRLDLPTLEYRRMFCDMVQVYKHLHVYDKATIPKKFIHRSRPNRHHKDELLPNFASDGFRGPQTKSFYYRCVPTWNKLPGDVVAAESIKVFKEKLKNAWKKHPQRFNTRNL